MKGECFACGKALAVASNANWTVVCPACAREAREDGCATPREFEQFYARKRIETRQLHPERGL